MKKYKHLLWSIFYLSATGLLIYSIVTNWEVYERTNKMRLLMHIIICVLATLKAISHFVKWRKEQTLVNR